MAHDLELISSNASYFITAIAVVAPAHTLTHGAVSSGDNHIGEAGGVALAEALAAPQESKSSLVTLSICTLRMH